MTTTATDRRNDGTGKPARLRIAVPSFRHLVAFPLLLFAGSVVFRGGLGLGDVKLLVSVGLLSGVSALLSGLLIASLAFGVILVVLLAVGRVGLRSYVPFGPVIIVAAAIGAVAP